MKIWSPTEPAPSIDLFPVKALHAAAPFFLGDNSNELQFLRPEKKARIQVNLQESALEANLVH
jgi:hypothetical protein